MAGAREPIGSVCALARSTAECANGQCVLPLAAGFADLAAALGAGLADLAAALGAGLADLAAAQGPELGDARSGIARARRSSISSCTSRRISSSAPSER